MSSERVQTTSVSSDVVETSPIVLRESQDGTRRLVFLPTLVRRENPLRGCFVYQRKLAAETWEDIRTESLGTLRAGEGYVLELKSAEVAALMEGLQTRKAFFDEHGIVWGSHEFVSSDNLPDVVRGLIEFPESELADVLRRVDAEDLLNLARRVDLSKLDALLEQWRDNSTNDSESFWQDLLTENTWALSQLTGSPVVLLQDRAYVGGKGIANRGGGEVDFLLRNELTANVSFVEIKTPMTEIIASNYRSSGSFTLDKETTGGIVQVLGYRESFANSLHSMQANTADKLQAWNPRSYLIVGTASTLQPDEARSFELFRNALAGVQILTFDEVERRLQGIREVLTSE